MLQKLSKFQIIAFLLIFAYLTILKLHEYDRIPTAGHAEEQMYAWAGLYLLQDGYPVAWSTLDYPKDYIFFDGIRGEPDGVNIGVKLFKPWLDEPPLYSLMVGKVAEMYGDSKEDVVPVSHVRIISTLISLATMFLVFLVGLKFHNFLTGVLAMLIYGTSPLIVFGSRLSVPENFIAFGVILALYLIHLYLKKPNRIIPVSLGISSGLLGLMKPTGFFLAFLVAFFTIKKRRWRDTLTVLTLAFIGVAIFLYYGYHYDWELFRKIIQIQGNRFAGWSGLGYILTTPAYDIFEMFDGWYIFALFSSIFFVFKHKQKNYLKTLTTFFIFWILIAVFSGSEQDLLPWYRYPIFPLISIMGALMLEKIYKKPEFVTMALVVGLLLSSRYLLKNDFRPTTPPNVFRVFYFISIIPSLYYSAFKNKVAIKASRAVFVLVVLMGLYFNSKYVYSAFAIRCENFSCALDTPTRMSTIHLPIFWRLLVPGDPTDMLTTKRPWF